MSDFCLDCRLPSPTLSPERNLLCRLCRRMEVFAEDSTEKPNPFFSLLELISNSGVSAKIQLFRLLFEQRYSVPVASKTKTAF